MNEEVFDVVIIGSGPAGLTAGIYASRANLKTVLLAGEKWGGQLMLTTDVENFPGFPEGIQGPELMERIRKQAERFGVKFVDKNVTGVNFSKRPYEFKYDEGSVSGKAVIIATGAETKWLGLPGEQKLIGRGVSSCAPCDAPFFRNKRVVVVGGGDAAMEEASVLTKFASEVILVHRRDEFRASKIMQDRVLNNPKIKVIWNTEVEDVIGEQKVEKLKLKTTVGGKLSKEGLVEMVEGVGGNMGTDAEVVSWELPTDGIFVAIGHTPVTKLFEGSVNLDQKGYVVSHRHDKYSETENDLIHRKYKTMTNLDGVFVAGDVHDYNYRQAITAAGYGCEAALDAEKWLEEQVVEV